MNRQEIFQELREGLLRWVDENKESKKPVARGTIAGALVVLDRVIEAWPRTWESCLSKVKGQLRNCTGESVQSVIAKFGKHHRIYCKEGGRTNRRQRPATEALFEVLCNSGLQELSENDRKWVASQLQCVLYEDFIKPWYENAGITFRWTALCTSQEVCRRLLLSARDIGASGAFAQHIIGSILRLAQPAANISNYCVSAADSSSSRGADFEVGNSAIHVTVAPNEGLIHKCEGNLDEGLDPLIVTTQEGLLYAEDLVRQRKLDAQVIVMELTQFVSEAVELQSDFDPAKRVIILVQLLEEYNRRVKEAESDHSSCIVIPKNLLKAYGAKSEHVKRR